ncbi:pyridoxal phosphate-dependent transferase, partial [Vararia minispora EC-137]
ETAAAVAEEKFRAAYPEYAFTLPLDLLRDAEFTRIRPGETYVDSMGGALYPELLVRAHAAFLENAILGNTHSQSSSSQLSTAHVAAAREAVLSHFNAPSGSRVVFTANASQALKLAGESFPFGPGSTYLLPEDAHNSVHGIREFARRGGAEVVYMPGRPGRGGVDVAKARGLLDANAPLPGDAALAAFTGMSNLTNTKMSLGPIRSVNSLGYTTLLDAAALAPSTVLDLTATPVDAAAVSFYKMFGYPTGIGALILGPGVGEFLVEPRLSGAGGRPWFAGGTVDVVQVPGDVVTRTNNIEEAFEDGTLNYLQLPAIPLGLNLLRSYLPFLPTRLAALTHFLASQLSSLTHADGTPAARVLSRVPGVISGIGGTSQRRLPRGAGGTVSFVILEPNGEPVPLSCVAASAAANGVMLRTGCMCNPGGAAALLGLAPFMAELRSGATLSSLEAAAGHELGVVRVSFGFVSNWKDAWAVVCWAR